MDNRIRFLPAVLAFTALSLPGVLFAVTGHVRFWVEGQSSCTREIIPPPPATPPGATTLAINQACPSSNPMITISSTALLDTDGTSESSQDAWRMKSTVSITANQAISGLSLFFLREAASGPTLTYYKTWVKGGVSNGSGTIKVTGSVKRVSDGATLTLDPVTVSGSSFESSSVKQWTNGSLTGNRELQVELEIVSLTQGAILNLALGGGGFIKLRSQGTPDNPDPPVACNDSGNWFLTTTCLTIHKLGYPTNVIVGPVGTDEQVARAYEFAQYNWENLSQDMARGQGEHLVSLATLLNVPAEQQPAFFELAQGTYRTSIGVETPEQVVASLQKTWSSR